AYRSWQARALLTATNSTQAEGLATRTAFDLPQRIMWELLDDFVLVSEDALTNATRLMIEKTRNLVEPAGAAALAAVLADPGRFAGRNVTIVCSGGNIRPVQLAALRPEGDRMTLAVGFAAVPEAQRAAEVERLGDAMEAADRAGRYPRLTVERPWSAHNPVLEGEFACPRAIRWYLERELGRLAAGGARISVCAGRPALDLHDPRLGPAVDETSWDLRRKKLFLFGPERMALSIDRLQHYTGTSAECFQRYVLLTNYSWHVEEFR